MNIASLILTPIKAPRWRYVPLLMIYFAYGGSAFSGIAESFFIKERLGFSAETLMMISVWLTLPWTIKMVFGQLVDSVQVLGSHRRVYIFVAAGLMALGSFLLAGLAGNWPWLVRLGSPFSIYFTSSLITVIGLVLQDVVADAMSVDVVLRKGRSEEVIKDELAMVQLLGRLSLSLAMFLVAGMGGWLAQHTSYEKMFLLTLIIPAISVSGTLFIRIQAPVLKPIQWRILGGGLIYAVFMVLMGVMEVPYNQEIIFVVSMIIVSYFLNIVTRELSSSARRQILYVAIVIFIFRAMPPIGPGLQWWEIDVLGFDKAFFGTLGQIGAGLSIIGMWVFAKYLTQKPIGWIFVVLTIIGFFLSLPVIGLYYGIQEWTQAVFGFGAHTIAIVDTAISSPFAQLSMIPMLTLIAVHAPRGNAATWFALMASLMNLALTAGSLASKYLNSFFIVTRELRDSAGKIIVQANYSHLGTLLWICVLAGLILPIAAIFIFLRRDLSRF